MKNNCRLQYTKDNPSKLGVFDMITIDTIVGDTWKEASFIFKKDEREKYKDLIELYNLIK